MSTLLGQAQIKKNENGEGKGIGESYHDNYSGKGDECTFPYRKLL